MIGGDDTRRNVPTVVNSLTQCLIQNSSEGRGVCSLRPTFKCGRLAVPDQSTRKWGNDREWNRFGVGFCAESRLAKQSETAGPTLFCRWARFAIVSFRPVMLDLGV